MLTQQSIVKRFGYHLALALCLLLCIGSHFLAELNVSLTASDNSFGFLCYGAVYPAVTSHVNRLVLRASF